MEPSHSPGYSYLIHNGNTLKTLNEPTKFQNKGIKIYVELLLVSLMIQVSLVYLIAAPEIKEDQTSYI